MLAPFKSCGSRPHAEICLNKSEQASSFVASSGTIYPDMYLFFLAFLFQAKFNQAANKDFLLLFMQLIRSLRVLFEAEKMCDFSFFVS